MIRIINWTKKYMQRYNLVGKLSCGGDDFIGMGKESQQSHIGKGGRNRK